MYERRCYVSVCELNGYIYAMGGHNGVERLRSMERYDPCKNQWTLLQPMIVRRSDAAACRLNGKIYIFGNFMF